MDLNLKLKLLRLSRSIKQNTMAEHLGISQQAYSKWETTKRHFTLEELEKLSAILQVDIAYLISKDELLPPLPQQRVSGVFANSRQCSPFI